jgi:hypothetical protein
MRSHRFTIQAWPAAQLADLELITAGYVAWCNRQRLVHRLGRIQSAEAEAEYHETSINVELVRRTYFVDHVWCP